MKGKNKSKILVVVAHPDDEVLGCGGTIAKYAQEGSAIYCLFLGNGKASRFSSQNLSKIKKEQIILEKEIKKAAKIIGIKKIFLANFPDQQYDKVPILTIIKAIDKIKYEVEPDIVFTHHSGDLNRDHQITLQAVLTVCRPIKGETVKRIYSFEVLSSTEWGIPNRKSYFVPNIFIDISDTLEKKIKAIRAYKSEIRKYPHPRSAEGIKISAQRRGMEVGLRYAEAFELIRCIK